MKSDIEKEEELYNDIDRLEDPISKYRAYNFLYNSLWIKIEKIIAENQDKIREE